MSIGSGIVISISFQEIDNSPNCQTSSDCNNQSL